jgi:hypothetical protein
MRTELLATMLTVRPADSGIAFGRSTTEVLAIVYLGGTGGG